MPDLDGYILDLDFVSLYILEQLHLVVTQDIGMIGQTLRILSQLELWQLFSGLEL